MHVFSGKLCFLQFSLVCYRLLHNFITTFIKILLNYLFCRSSDAADLVAYAGFVDKSLIDQATVLRVCGKITHPGYTGSEF